jgi:hypothetical protein
VEFSIVSSCANLRFGVVSVRGDWSGGNGRVVIIGLCCSHSGPDAGLVRGIHYLLLKVLRTISNIPAEVPGEVQADYLL